MRLATRIQRAAVKAVLAGLGLSFLTPAGFPQEVAQPSSTMGEAPAASEPSVFALPLAEDRGALLKLRHAARQFAAERFTPEQVVGPLTDRLVPSPAPLPHARA